MRKPCQMFGTPKFAFHLVNPYAHTRTHTQARYSPGLVATLLLLTPYSCEGGSMNTRRNHCHWDT